jgi:hypothetical protein
MRAKFPLFNNPIDLAHLLWGSFLSPKALAIDATCGNGKDSLALSFLLQKHPNTALFCIDIQQQAIQKTKDLLWKQNPSFAPFTSFFHQSHETLPPIPSHLDVKLVTLNLGYLPGGDKAITTLAESTLKSLDLIMDLLVLGGAISITCYPGHPEGKKEETVLLERLSLLPPSSWSFTSFFWPNRKDSPSLLLLQKAL